MEHYKHKVKNLRFETSDEKKVSHETKNMKFATEYVCIGRAGTMHLRKGLDGQDAFFYARDGTRQFFGLADGQTGTKYGAQGGREALAVLFESLRQKSIAELRHCSYQDELRYELMHGVRRKLDELAQRYGVGAEEFSSTFMVLMLDSSTGEYMTLHLGDGMILAISREHSDMGRTLLSRPENGITSQYTWFTTTDNALLHLRIGFGCAEQYKRIVLLTDGAYLLSNWDAGGLLTSGSPADIWFKINKMKPEDDASCLLIDLVLNL